MSNLKGLIIVALLFPSVLWAEEKDAEAEIKELSGISIIGNKEAPKSLYIVPWKSSEVGVERELVSTLMNNKLDPLDKEVFMRELEFYQLSLTDK